MRFNRTLLYAGIFLVAIGAVVVAADQGRIDTATLIDVLRLWPLAAIAVGLGLVLRRTRISLGGGVLAAVAPGLLIGSAFAILPRFAGDCGARTETASTTTEHGTLGAAASVSIRSACGLLRITTAPGNAWQLVAASTAGRPPSIISTPESLSITGARSGWNLLGAGRDTWDLMLPSSELADLSLIVNAGRCQVRLPGAHISDVAVIGNLSDVVVDASEASIDTLSVALNMASMSLHLPAGGDLSGTLKVGGGEIQVCAPPELGLHVTSNGSGSDFTIAGLHESGSEWISANYGSAPYHAELSVTASFGAVAINPIGGCR
jgi:hypothetical protein